MPRRSKKHDPPSRLRYIAAHPTVSVRVTRELYDKLKALRKTTGKSLGDILREAVKVQSPKAGRAYQRGFVAGRKAAEAEYLVVYRCARCEGPLRVDTQEEKQAAAQYMTQHHWHHTQCPP